MKSECLHCGAEIPNYAGKASKCANCNAERDRYLEFLLTPCRPEFFDKWFSRVCVTLIYAGLLALITEGVVWIIMEARKP